MAKGQAENVVVVDSEDEDMDEIAPHVCTHAHAKEYVRALLDFVAANRGLDSKEEPVVTGTYMQCLEKIARGLDRMFVTSAHVQLGIGQLL